MNQLLRKRMKEIAFLGTVGVLSFTLVAKPAMKKIKAYVNPTIAYTLNGERVLKGAQTLTYDNKTYVPIADVAKLMDIKVKFENNTIVMTKKAQTPTPPTTTQLTTPTQQVVTIAKAVIKEVQSDTKKVTILKDGDQDSYIVLGVSDTTKIIDEENKAYAMADLKTGAYVSIKHSPVMTSSIPPQTEAYEIKLLKQNTDENKYENKDGDKDKDKVNKDKNEVKIHLENIKILEINNSGKYLVVEDGKGGQLKITFSNKTKVKYEGEKKQPNANALKAGQVVAIKLEGTISENAIDAVKELEIIVKAK